MTACLHACAHKCVCEGGGGEREEGKDKTRRKTGIKVLLWFRDIWQSSFTLCNGEMALAT